MIIDLTLNVIDLIDDILRDNDAIHATEVAVGKFLTSQIEDASNVTITAVDAQFIPYSRSRGESLLRER